ncbi:hypothetical protein GW17_00060348 [Ensete ventricosum]|nr:hypothetical protein GW17_00060348 [Ensete ventricosum]
MSQALTLSFTLLRRRRRHCPCADGSAACCGQQPPCQGAATPAVSTVAPTCDSPLRVRHGQPLTGWLLALAGWPQPTAPAGGRPLRVVAPAGGRPLQVAGNPLVGGPWLQPVAPARGELAVASCPLAGGLGRSRLPLAACHGQPLLLVVLATNAEIVYPCIPDPDGEDEGGQASSLAVSTRWISVAKLLLFDLATLAQREGGE